MAGVLSFVSFLFRKKWRFSQLKECDVFTRDLVVWQEMEQNHWTKRGAFKAEGFNATDE